MYNRIIITFVKAPGINKRPNLGHFILTFNISVYFYVRMEDADGADMVHEVANVDMAEIGSGVLDFMADLTKLLLRFSCRHSLEF